jgi:hypothetical protein
MRKIAVAYAVVRADANLFREHAGRKVLVDRQRFHPEPPAGISITGAIASFAYHALSNRIELL